MDEAKPGNPNTFPQRGEKLISVSGIAGVKASDPLVPFSIYGLQQRTFDYKEEGATPTHHSYNVTLKCGERTIVVQFTKGTYGTLKGYGFSPNRTSEWKIDYNMKRTQHEDAKRSPVPPQIDELSDCLRSDCQGIRDNPTFEDFADSFGYDTDSIKSRDTYFACQGVYTKMRKLLGGEFWKWLNSPNSDEEVEQEEEQSVSERLDVLYTQAFVIGVKHVEKLAREILKTHPELSEFTMAMGAYCFSERRPAPATDIQLGGEEREFFKPLFDFMNDWDRVLKLSGSPMRFTAEGPVVTEW